MAEAQNARIPAPVVQRLTQYLVHLEGLRQEAVEWVSSREIAAALGLTSSTVRQDLSYLEFSGTSKRGYETAKLERALHLELGADRESNVVIVGAGNLGRALALHGEFGRRGFMIRAVFDSAPHVVGKRIGGVRVRSMAELEPTVRDESVDIGVIAVPGAAAQEVGDALVKAGVRGLLNLTPAHVTAPPPVAVVDARIVASLQELSYLMKAKDITTPTKACGHASS